MIKITAELISANGESRNQKLGTIIISNDGSGTPARGNYNAVISKRGKGGLWKKCTVSNFPRKQLNTWDLLFCALCSIIPERIKAHDINAGEVK